MSKITVVINNMEGDRFNLKTLNIDIKKIKKIVISHPLTARAKKPSRF